MRPEHIHTWSRLAIAPCIYHILANTKSFLPCVDNTKGGLVPCIHHSFSKRRTHCVTAEQERFMGANGQSKLHSWLHHRFLLGISCTQHKETHPTFNYVALNLPSKWEYWGLTPMEMRISMLAPLCVRSYLDQDGLVTQNGQWPESPPHSSICVHGLVQALPCTCAATYTSAAWV